MIKKISFYLVLLVALIIINSPWLTPFLDGIFGVTWSGPIVAILKTNSQGLLISFLVAFYIEVVKSKDIKNILIKKDQIEISEGLLKMVAKFDLRAIIEIILESILNKSSHRGSVSSLVEVVMPTPFRSIYYDVKVTYILSDVPENNDKYYMVYNIEFSSCIKEYILVVTRNGVLQERISNKCPKVSDVVTVPTMIQSNDYLTDLAKKISIKKISNISPSGEVQTSLPISLIKSEREIAKYLPGIPQEDYKEFILLKASCGKNPDSMCTYLVSTPALVLNKSDHFVYWVSDRPMWIERIEFDASNLTFNGRQDFSIQPLLMNYTNRTSQALSDSKMSFRVHNWVAKGHGAIFSWR